MPYVEGESLRDRLERERQLTVAEAVRTRWIKCTGLGKLYPRLCVGAWQAAAVRTFPSGTVFAEREAAG